jgi:hypothetical protein
VEELLRKLLLSAVVVLIDEGSPLQVTLAVLVSGWAHVLHAQYKPWGGGSVLYRLQHGALFVTSFVFLMGLLFKVDGVSSSSGTYSALSGVMVALCVAFMAAWVAVIALRVASMWRAARKTSLSRRQSRSDDRMAATATATRMTDATSGRASSGGGGTVVAVDSLAVPGVVSDATATATAPSDGFVVMNPLRHAKADGGRDGGATDSDGPESTSGTSQGDRGDAGEQRHRSPKPVAVSRLQRVLAAQQPVTSKRGGGSGGSSETTVTTLPLRYVWHSMPRRVSGFFFVPPLSLPFFSLCLPFRSSMLSPYTPCSLPNSSACFLCHRAVPNA